MAMDEYLWSLGLPVIIWGASVGPFDEDPAFAAKMFGHLTKMRSIVVRESTSFAYLAEAGLERSLLLGADPAFAMAPVAPLPSRIGCELPSDAVGLNLSPLMAKYVTQGNLPAWVGLSVEIVKEVVDRTHLPILLVPHVTRPGSDDREFLLQVVSACRAAGVPRVECVSGTLSAAELKHIIAACKVFAGARTHSTIAGISSCIPTVSFAYSRKAWGLNQDVFGSQDYCIQPSEITPARVGETIANVVENSGPLRQHLSAVVPRLRDKAFDAGRAVLDAL
jgi:polysaccharide pyruvyl transferase WcaK-like protein